MCQKFGNQFLRIENNAHNKDTDNTIISTQLTYLTTHNIINNTAMQARKRAQGGGGGSV